MPALRIVGLCVLAAVAYGVVHDQVTARVCLEYFTVAHPKIVESESPTVLGLVWGVVATWWVGLALGIVVALAARAGPRPKVGARRLAPRVAILLAAMAATAAVAGVAGFLLARSGAVVLLEPMASRIPADRHVRFLAVLWSHVASYASGAIGGALLAWRTWRGRAAPG